MQKLCEVTGGRSSAILSSTLWKNKSRSPTRTLRWRRRAFVRLAPRFVTIAPGNSPLSRYHQAFKLFATHPINLTFRPAPAASVPRVTSCFLLISPTKWTYGAAYVAPWQLPARKLRPAPAISQATTLSMQAELAYDYFELRSADSQKRLLDETVNAYADMVDLTGSLFNGGAAPESDVVQARTQLDTTRVQDTDIGVMRAQYEHAIAILIGKPPAEFAIASRSQPFEPPGIPVGLPSQLLERRPDIASAERRVAEANEGIGIARAAYFPSLTIGGVVGLQSAHISNLFTWPSRVWAIGPQASEIIYDGGRRRAGVQQAQANYDATVATYRETTLEAFQQVEDNLAALRILAQEATQEEQAVDESQRNLRLFTNLYEGGADPYLEVVTAQTTLLFNQRNEIDILRRQMDASVLLIKAIGGGWNASQLPPTSTFALMSLNSSCCFTGRRDGTPRNYPDSALVR